MINLFIKYRHIEYKDILKKAFPKELEEDLDIVLNKIPFSNNEIKQNNGSILKVDNLIFDNSQIIKFKKEELAIPYRVYFNEPEENEEKSLTTKQQAILSCIYSRHHNGFVRQKRLEKLANFKEYWTTPFIFQLLGEYVIEIIKIIDKQIEDSLLENLKQLSIDNPKYFIETENRMISYWNVYYRQATTKLENYIGGLIFRKIKIKTIGLCLDEISEIAIDEKERLIIKPLKIKFELIYRTATEVHWDESILSLYSPKPREHSYLDWFNHIIGVARNECNAKLIVTTRTKWTNINDELRKEIITIN